MVKYRFDIATYKCGSKSYYLELENEEHALHFSMVTMKRFEQIKEIVVYECLTEDTCGPIRYKGTLERKLIDRESN